MSSQDRVEIAALTSRVQAETAAMLRTGGWPSWLRLAARFPHLGYTNTVLVWWQNPKARMLATAADWRRRGRRVADEESGIRILAPQRDTTRPYVSSTSRASAPTVISLFDVTQTLGPDGAVELTPASLEDGCHPDGYEALARLAQRRGFTITRSLEEPTATFWKDRRIVLDAAGSSAERVAALAHELGHILLTRPGTDPDEADTAQCHGASRAAATAISLIAATRLGMDVTGYRFSPVSSWAGSDPRAQPDRAVRALSETVMTAGALLHAHLDAYVPKPQLRPVPPAATAMAARRADVAQKTVPAAAPTAPPEGTLTELQAIAAEFFSEQVEASWVPDYLAGRGFPVDTLDRWGIGYAPAGRYTLVNYLRSLTEPNGQRRYDDATLLAASLASESRYGLVDFFRDRLIIPIRHADGTIAGFSGRRSPHASDKTPKYKNSHDSELFNKGNLLFGLHEGREALQQGACPTVVEGPLDAIAINSADPVNFVGLSPGGTALTQHQISLIRYFAPPELSGLLLGYDQDKAGNKATRRAFDRLGTLAENTRSVIYESPGDDPAEVLRTSGAAHLAHLLRHGNQPLAGRIADLVIDEYLPAEVRESRSDAERTEAVVKAVKVIGHLPLETLTRETVRLAAALALPPSMPQIIVEALTGENPEKLRTAHIAGDARGDFPVLLESNPLPVVAGRLRPGLTPWPGPGRSPQRRTGPLKK